MRVQTRREGKGCNARTTSLPRGVLDLATGGIGRTRSASREIGRQRAQPRKATVLPFLSANRGRKEPLDRENPAVPHLKTEEPRRQRPPHRGKDRLTQGFRK